jgi:hypothetical protein
MDRMEEAMSSVISLAKILAGLLLLATPALAIDGEILIDQARVNAGGITPGDTPGFPATLSRPGRYKLTGNLRVPAGKSGIEVVQHDVTVDLNGLTISSAPTAQVTAGVRADAVGGGASAQRLTVRNGTITGFHDGIRAGLFAVIENMRITGINVGVHAASSRVAHSTITGNGYAGVSCAGCVLEQNLIALNLGYGAIVDGGDVVLGNLIVSNIYEGIYCQGTCGYGNNLLFENNNNGAQVAGSGFFPLHPNICEPACP